MKKFLVFFATLCAVCSALNAQVFYEGEGGKNLGTIRVSEIVPRGEKLSKDEAVLLPSIQTMLSADFNKYAGMEVAARQEYTVSYTLSGTITKTPAGAFILDLAITDRVGIIKTMIQPKMCILSGYQIFQVIKDASEELISGMGVKLTPAGRDALRVEKEEWKKLANADSPTQWGRPDYSYKPEGLDPKLVEAARRLGAIQVEINKAPEINLAMPDIRIPEIKAPEFKAPEIKMVATGNIGTDARRRQEQYEAQREVSRIRQESGNNAVKKMQDDFLTQFKSQAEAVKKQQADLMGHRNILLGQQRTLLERQRQIITRLRETENSSDTFFMEHPPFEIIYDPKAVEVGNQNVQKGTIDLQFQITSVGTNGMQVIPLMIAEFEKGLGTIDQGLKTINAEFYRVQSLIAQVEAAGKNALLQLVKDYAAQMEKVQAAERDYAAQLARLDTVLKTDGYAQLGRDYAVKPDTGYAEQLAREYAVLPAGYNAAGDKTRGDTWSLTKWNRDETRTFAIEARLENESGKTIGTASVTLTNRIFATAYTRPMSDSAFCVFRDVPVKDITDTLNVSIQWVNNRNITATANAGYIKISPLEADGYTKDGWNIDGYGKNRRNQMGLTRQETEKPLKEKEKAADEERRKAWWAEHHYAIYPWWFQVGYNFQPGYTSGFRVGIMGVYMTMGFSNETYKETKEDKDTKKEKEIDKSSHLLFTVGYAFSIIENWLIIPIGAGLRMEDSITGKPAAPVIEAGYELDLGFYRPLARGIALSFYGTYRLIDFKESSFSIGVGLNWR